MVETKGREDLNDPLKMARLKQWCEDINEQNLPAKWGFVFVDDENFEKYRPTSFESLIRTFRKYN